MAGDEDDRDVSAMTFERAGLALATVAGEAAQLATLPVVVVK
jgi:hypothetical protein